MGIIHIIDAELFPHLPITLADENFILMGGRISAGEIGVPGEFTLEPLGDLMKRKKPGEWIKSPGIRLMFPSS